MFGFFKKRRRTAPPALTISSKQVPLDWDTWRASSANRPQLDDQVLSARLAETVTWCDSLSSLADFKSAALRPILLQDSMDSLVCDLGKNRQFQLRHTEAQVRYGSPVFMTGRLMLYFPDENLSDGYAEIVSGGFFDVDNVPAFDTWVSFFSEEDHPRTSARRYLLCYVPPLMTVAADAGIEGNPESCIQWLERSDVSIRRRLKALTRVASHG